MNRIVLCYLAQRVCSYIAFVFSCLSFALSFRTSGGLHRTPCQLSQNTESTSLLFCPFTTVEDGRLALIQDISSDSWNNVVHRLVWCATGCLARNPELGILRTTAPNSQILCVLRLLFRTFEFWRYFFVAPLAIFRHHTNKCQCRPSYRRQLFRTAPSKSFAALFFNRSHRGRYRP